MNGARAQLYLKKADAELSLDAAKKHFNEWVLGITMLIVALVASSYLAICQERLYSKHGKHPREAMFYIVSWPGDLCTNNQVL